MIGSTVTHDVLVQRADDLAPVLWERAALAEATRQVPDETIADVARADLFRIALPTRWGGYGMDLRTVTEVGRRLARGCLSSAWTIEFLIEHNWMLSRFPLEAQEDVFQDGKYVLATGPLYIPQKAESVDGGFLVNGRWPYATGVMHSDWAMVNIAVDGEDGPVPHIALMPIGDVTIHDTWFFTGAAATGSHDISAANVFVPAHRTVPAALWGSHDNPGVEIHPDDPFICAPLVTCASFFLPAIAVGAAERALELFKERVGSRVVAHSGGIKQRDWPPVQERYAKACENVRLATILLTNATDSIATTYSGGSQLAENERAMLRIDGAMIARLAHEAVTLLIDSSGSSTYKVGDPLLRIKRDVDVLKSHPTTDWDSIAAPMGSVLLGNAPREADFF